SCRRAAQPYRRAAGTHQLRGTQPAAGCRPGNQHRPLLHGVRHQDRAWIGAAPSVSTRRAGGAHRLRRPLITTTAAAPSPRTPPPYVAVPHTTCPERRPPLPPPPPAPAPHPAPAAR